MKNARFSAGVVSGREGRGVGYLTVSVNVLVP